MLRLIVSDSKLVDSKISLKSDGSQQNKKTFMVSARRKGSEHALLPGGREEDVGELLAHDDEL